MKNYVVLLAGGVGNRMGTATPKQFLEVDGKPIIVYTIERFQRNPQIEKIVVVCVKDWMEYLCSLVKTYSLTKVEWITEGGKTGHDSIRNGVFFLKDKIKPDDFIILIYLKWDQKNGINMTQQMLEMYSDDMAATLADQYQDASEIALFWEVPYLLESGTCAKYAYTTSGGHAYRSETVGPLYN